MPQVEEQSAFLQNFLSFLQAFLRDELLVALVIDPRSAVCVLLVVSSFAQILIMKGQLVHMKVLLQSGALYKNNITISYRQGSILFWTVKNNSSWDLSMNRTNGAGVS